MMVPVNEPITRNLNLPRATMYKIGFGVECFSSSERFNDPISSPMECRNIGAGPPFTNFLNLPQLRLPHPSRFSKGGRQEPQPHLGTRTLSSAFFCSSTNTRPASP